MVCLQTAKRSLLTKKGLELDGDEVDRSTFPLPTLGPKLEQLARDIHSGKGFGCVSGLDPVYYSSEDNVIIFLGISSYIGEKRGVQSDQGEMLSQWINVWRDLPREC